MKTNDAFLKIIEEIRYALEIELYHCALALALTLPDICGKVEYPSGESNKARYIKWLHVYAEPYFTVDTEVLTDNTTKEYNWFPNAECYALRCAVLHAGNYELEKTSLSIVEIHAHKRDGNNYSHMVKGDNYVDWDVIHLCETLCLAAEKYYLNSNKKDEFNVAKIRIDNW